MSERDSRSHVSGERSVLIPKNFIRRARDGKIIVRGQRSVQNRPGERLSNNPLLDRVKAPQTIELPGDSQPSDGLKIAPFCGFREGGTDQRAASSGPSGSPGLPAE